MKNSTHKIKIDGLFIGIAHSLLAATKVSLVMALIFAFTSIYQHTLLEFLKSFMGMFVMLAFFGGFITMAICFFIGIPVTIILIKSGLDDELLSAFIGFLIVAFYYLISGNIKAYVIFLCIYAFFCGMAFMKGYKT